MRTLIKKSVIKRPLEEVFGFFSNAENLNLLTPPEVEFKILTPTPIKMEPGAIINYSIKLGWIRFKWKTEISAWEPPYRFVDIQLKGPYKLWIHEHTFIENGNSTIVKDKVDYISRGWFLEPLIHKLFVQKKLANIFDYRQNKLNLIFKDDN